MNIEDNDSLFGDGPVAPGGAIPRKAATAGAPFGDYNLPSLIEEAGSGTLDMLMDVNLQVTVELGRTRMTVRQVLELQRGSVVELNRIAGDPVDVYVNERLIARGEVVVVDDKFGVRITELISTNRKVGEV
jgi:flagellar motor switch protein FliN/FliY